MTSFKPTTLLEHMMYSVKRVEGVVTDSTTSYGTGWMLGMPVTGYKNLQVQMLVTNRHVVDNVKSVRILFHTTTNGVPDGGQVFIVAPKSDIVIDPDGLDIALIKVGWVMNDWLCANPGRGLHCQTFSPEHFITETAERDLDACESILMVGCPNALWDERNGFPLFRRGVTASHPAIDFQGRPEIAIDIGVYGGSSGSPVMLWETGLVKTSKSGGYGSGFRFWLLGMLWGGPTVSDKGTLVDEPVPTSLVVRTDRPMHLGYAIKAREILRLATAVRDEIVAHGPMPPQAIAI